MFGSIPMPKGFGESFLEGSTKSSDMLARMMNAQAQKAEMERLQKLLPYEEALKSGQAQQALSTAAWNNFLRGGAVDSTNVPTAQGQSSATSSPNANVAYNALQEMLTQKGFPGASLPPQSIAQQGLQSAPATQNIRNDANSLPVSNSQLGAEEVLNPGNPELEHLNKVAGLSGVPAVDTKTENGYLISRYPSGKITRQLIGQTDLEKEAAKGYLGADVGEYKEAVKHLEGAQDLQYTVNQIQDVLRAPLWQEMSQNMLTKFGKKASDFNLWANTYSGSPEAQKLIGEMRVLTGSLITQGAQSFKGAFRIGEQKLLENMKIDPADPYNIQVGKAQALSRANEYAMKINALKAQYMRDNHLSSHAALDKARREVNTDDFFDSLKKESQPQQPVYINGKWYEP